MHLCGANREYRKFCVRAGSLVGHRYIVHLEIPGECRILECALVSKASDVLPVFPDPQHSVGCYIWRMNSRQR